MATEIRVPISILGAPRSGTSVLYEKLARHHSVQRRQSDAYEPARTRAHRRKQV